MMKTLKKRTAKARRPLSAAVAALLAVALAFPMGIATAAEGAAGIKEGPAQGVAGNQPVPAPAPAPGDTAPRLQL